MTSDSVTRIAEKIADDYGINPNWGRQESLRWIESLLREAMSYVFNKRSDAGSLHPRGGGGQDARM